MFGFILMFYIQFTFKAYQVQDLTGKLGYEQFSLQNFHGGGLAKQSLVRCVCVQGWGEPEQQAFAESAILCFFVAGPNVVWGTHENELPDFIYNTFHLSPPKLPPTTPPVRHPPVMGKQSHEERGGLLSSGWDRLQAVSHCM